MRFTHRKLFCLCFDRRLDGIAPRTPPLSCWQNLAKTEPSHLAPSDLCCLQTSVKIYIKALYTCMPLWNNSRTLRPWHPVSRVGIILFVLRSSPAITSDFPDSSWVMDLGQSIIFTGKILTNLFESLHAWNSVIRVTVLLFCFNIKFCTRKHK